MTNTATYPSGTWVNSDGLPVRLGRAGQLDAVVGEASTYGDEKQLIVDLVWERLPLHTATENLGMIYGGYPNSAIPAGAFIKSVSFQASTDFVGATATLSLGLVQADGTEIDNDGLIDALAITSMQVADGAQAGAGALVGTVLATTGYVWVSVQTADITAGRGRVLITYYRPATAANNS